LPAPAPPGTLGEFGRAIRERRKTLDIAQDKLAALIGVAQSYISSIERGRIDVRVGTVKAIADALGLDAEELLTKLSDDRDNPDLQITEHA
jgi:transcriptional regulator with XRE-family HTH domain